MKVPQRLGDVLTNLVRHLLTPIPGGTHLPPLGASVQPSETPTHPSQGMVTPTHHPYTIYGVGPGDLQLATLVTLDFTCSMVSSSHSIWLRS